MCFRITWLECRGDAFDLAAVAIAAAMLLDSNGDEFVINARLRRDFAVVLIQDADMFAYALALAVKRQLRDRRFST